MRFRDLGRQQFHQEATHLLSQARLVGRSLAHGQDLRRVLNPLRARREHDTRGVVVEVAEVDGGRIAAIPKRKT
jgi:hypothetical protein